MKKSNLVSVPATTLSALKSLLFNSNNGVDLSSIISDMSANYRDDQKDLIAINIGLTFKGMRPEIDKTPRFRMDNYSSSYNRYDIQEFSMITNNVKYLRTNIYVDADGNETAKSEEIGFQEYFDFLELTSDYNEVYEKCLARAQAKESEK